MDTRIIKLTEAEEGRVFDLFGVYPEVVEGNVLGEKVLVYATSENGGSDAFHVLSQRQWQYIKNGS